MIVRIVEEFDLSAMSSDEPLRSRYDGAAQAVCVSALDLKSGLHVSPKIARNIDRFTSMAIKIADDARDSLERMAAPDRIGVFVGNVFGGWNYAEEDLRALHDSGPATVRAHLATAWFPAAAQGEITIKHQWTGAAKTFSGRESCLAEALLAAAMAVELRRIDAALVLWSESLLSDFLLWGVGLRSADRLSADVAYGLVLASGSHAAKAGTLVKIERETGPHPGYNPLLVDSDPCAVLRASSDSIQALLSGRSEASHLSLNNGNGIVLRRMDS
ncbi:beta-ketoacyl synthase N-terminal-like domain-containing protein [Allorhizobium pseudoryzae]|uniref:beta-ketoacyl synthase N-terminal-like domain-containing protein n=1 Tax=Allorhizobium pseudoryzae TaxID=379684 RepID=UPI003D053EF3